MAGDPKIQIDITARDTASDQIEDVADAAGDLEKLSPEVAVTADTGSAKADIDAVADATGRLSHDDTVLVIKAQIDQAKGELKALQSQLGDVDTAAADTGRKLGAEMDEGATKAAGATHSMAGNVIGDSAAMATGFGPLGEAVGQVTEGLLGGEVAMKDLLTAGLSMGAITLVVGQITKALEANKAIDAFNKKKVEDFVTALKGAVDEVDVFKKALLNDDKLEWIDAGSGKTKDLTATLADAGITWDTFITQVSKGKDSFREWVIANGEAIGAGEGLNAIIQAGTQFVNDRAAAQKAYDDIQFVSGATAAETARETERLNHAFVDGSAALQDLKGDARATTTQIDRFKESTAQAEGAYRRLTGTLDEQDAWANVNQAIEDYAANTQKSDEDTRNLIRSIADYVSTTDTIPASKKTEILAELQAGDIAAAEAQLTELTRTRDIKLLLTAVGSADTIKLLRSIGRGGTGIVDEATTRGAGSTVVNINMPRGSNGVDVVRQVAGQARRSGRRYGNPVVDYARS